MIKIPMQKRDENSNIATSKNSNSAPKVTTPEEKTCNNFSIQIKKVFEDPQNNNDSEIQQSVDKFTIKIKPLEPNNSAFRQFKIKVPTFVDETTNTTEPYNEETAEDQISALTFC